MKINKSASRTLDVLELLANSEQPLTLLEIERALNIPKSSTFELVYALVEKEFIEQVDKKFALGVKAFKVGLSYARKLDLIQMSKDTLENLAKELKETVFLAKLINDKIVYIDKCTKYTDISSTCKIGSSKGLYYTALGKAILSTKSDEEIEQYFSRIETKKYTENTILDAKTMIEQVKVFKAQGFAVENGEGSENMYCVSCAIKDHNNKTVGAVSVASPIYKMDNDKKIKYGLLVNQAALEISNKLGFLQDRLY